jgi:hypothetical protein
MAVLKALISHSETPGGLTSSQLANKYIEIIAIPTNTYRSRQASYDLKKFRAKQLVHKITGWRRYLTDTNGIKHMVALLIWHEKAFLPLIDNSGKVPSRRRKKEFSIIDYHFRNIQFEMKHIFEKLNIAA